MTIGHNPAEGKVAHNDSGANSGHIGLALAPLTDNARSQLGLDKDIKGAVVARVAPGSVAEKSGIQPGDVIVKVGDKSVTSPDDAVAKIHAAEAGKKQAVALLVMRRGTTYYLALPLDKA